MSRERFIRKLGEQLEYIRSSSRQYDSGTFSEAFRIATSLRVLFHKTKISTPLVSHLRMEGWQMLSSGAPDAPFHVFVQIQLNINSPIPVLAAPRLGGQFWPMTLSDWWNQKIYRYKDRFYMRKDLILSAVNKDGGAHVDRELEKYYEDLESGLQSIGLNGQNLVFSGGPAPFDQTKTQYCQNLHVALIRQFGHEVLASERHFDWASKLSSR